MRGIRGMNDRWLRDQSVFSLLSSLSSLRLIRIRGLGTWTQTSVHAKSTCSSCLRRHDVCRYSCRLSVYVYLSPLLQNIILMYFLFCGFLVQDHREGPHAAGLKPLALFRDSTSHAVWKGSPSQCLLTAWQELPVRQVSTGGAHRDVWRLMYCWICCSTGGGRRRGTRERRRGLRAVVWEDEMEMYGVSDRCKIWDGRGKGGNDLRG